MASDNLIVIGYASKLFRDDIAAEYCHQEKQLHPHELDHYTTIDRFDVRGLLEFPIDFKKGLVLTSLFLGCVFIKCEIVFLNLE